MFIWIVAARKEVWALLMTSSRQVSLYRLPGLFGDFEPDRSTSLALPDGRAINAQVIWSNLVSQQADDITASQLAVDCNVEQGEITDLVCQLQPGADCPHMFRL